MDLSKKTSKSQSDQFIKKTLSDKVEGRKYTDQDFDKNYWYLLGKEDGETNYIESKVSTNKHWGQFKLLFSEIQFLTYYLRPDIKNIIYVGAAPGNHTYVLAHLFEDLIFHLYDIQVFDPRLEKLKNVNIYNKYFTEDDIEKHKKLNLKYMFVSDIRNLSVNKLNVNKRENEMKIWEDMQLQQSWVMSLKPVYSSLKFKLPYGSDEYNISKFGKTVKYLDGQIFKQVFCPPLSAESRLVVSKFEQRDWDLSSYERKMSYHNIVIREKATFKNPLTGKNENIYEERGLTNNSDSVCSYSIICDYLEKINKKQTVENVKIIFDYIFDNSMPDGSKDLLEIN